MQQRRKDGGCGEVKFPVGALCPNVRLLVLLARSRLWSGSHDLRTGGLWIGYTFQNGIHHRLKISVHRILSTTSDVPPNWTAKPTSVHQKKSSAISIKNVHFSNGLCEFVWNWVEVARSNQTQKLNTVFNFGFLLLWDVVTKFATLKVMGLLLGPKSTPWHKWTCGKVVQGWNL